MEMTSYQPGTPSWVDLGTPDPEAASEFYSALFGWEVSDMGPDAGGYRMATLGGKNVAGIGPQTQAGMPPYWTTYITSADADATTQAVRDAGGQVMVEPMDVFTSGRMAVFADPAGAPFSIWQPQDHIGAERVNETGTLCWNELQTRQVDEAKEFYTKVFGWGSETHGAGPGSYTEWKMDGKSIAGMMPMGPHMPPQVPSHWEAYFAVDDTDEAATRVTELGGTVVMPPMDIEPGRFAVVQDPQGATFSIIKFKPVAAS